MIVQDTNLSKNSLHDKLVENGKPVIADDCGKLGHHENRNEVRNQGKFMDVKERKMYDCTICSYRCVAKAGLEAHIRIHTGERPYKCNKCLYASTQLGNLKTHIAKMHKGAKSRSNLSICNVTKRKDKKQLHKPALIPALGNVASGINVMSAMDFDIKAEPGLVFNPEDIKTADSDRILRSDITMATIKNELKVKEEPKTDFDKNLSVSSVEIGSCIQAAFKCLKCPSAFRWEISLKVHSLVHNKKGNFQCPECPFVAPYEDYLLVHLSQHSTSKLHSCKYCCALFQLENSLYVHVRVNHTEAAVMGNIQTSLHNIKKKKRLLTKMDEVHSNINDKNVPPFSQAECGVKFSSKVARFYHNRVKNPMQFAASSIRQHSHSKKIHARSSFRCLKCKFMSRTANALISHSRCHAIEGTRCHRCAKCSYLARSQTALTMHMRVHTDVALYKCELCLAAFKWQGSMTIHMRTHTGEKPYQCQVCDFRCADRGNLRKHAQRHTNGCVTVPIRSRNHRRNGKDNPTLGHKGEEPKASHAVSSDCESIKCSKTDESIKCSKTDDMYMNSQMSSLVNNKIVPVSFEINDVTTNAKFNIAKMNASLGQLDQAVPVPSGMGVKPSVVDRKILIPIGLPATDA